MTPSSSLFTTRRDFLRTSLLGGALSWMGPNFIVQTFSTLQAADGSSPGGDAVPFARWPVKNGDFSLGEFDNIFGWTSHEGEGKHQVSFEPARNLFTLKPAALVVTTQQRGDIYFSQAVPLIKGEYSLSVDISGSGGAQARIQYQNGSTDIVKDRDATSEWQTIQFDLPKIDTADAQPVINLYATGPGTLKFRNVKIDIKSLDSAPIPFQDGGHIAGIILPDKPTLAEQYAVYELQRFIYRMTGLTPGLKGRDQVFNGTWISIGRSAVADGEFEPLAGKSPDAYLVGIAGKDIILAGNSDISTLYAVYDFLKQQGFLWVMPGPVGEVIPGNKALVCGPAQVQSPDYDIRGFYTLSYDCDLRGAGTDIDLDNYFDWTVRNRFNSMITLLHTTSDLGEQRGHGHIQMVGHSYSFIAPENLYFKDHPDWFPLVKGVRTAEQSPGQPDQLCVSSQGLRDHTIEFALNYFRDNPRSDIFSMNANDGAVYWCECPNCKALDSAEAHIDWSRNGIDQLFMTDRSVNYTNYVADQVAKIHPGKKISMYAYGCTREFPLKEKVHPNVIIHYATWQGVLNKPFSDTDPLNGWTKVHAQLDGWKKAGAQDLTYYGYLDYMHGNASVFWHNKFVELICGLHDQYGFKGFLGETGETSLQSSPTMYHTLAHATWDVKTEYKPMIKDICLKFYGAAGSQMNDYIMMMDDYIMTSDDRTLEARKKDAWCPNYYLEIPLEGLEKAKDMLDTAFGLVKGDSMLERRVALAQFSHANMALARSKYEEKDHHKASTLGRQAYDTAHALIKQYGFPINVTSVGMLNSRPTG